MGVTISSGLCVYMYVCVCVCVCVCVSECEGAEVVGGVDGGDH
jgi:hypothetical protein